MKNLNEKNAIATLKEYFEKCKAREEANLDNNYDFALENIEFFNEALKALHDMDLMVNCEEDYIS